MEMTEEEFCLWRKKVELKCHFCGIKEKDIPLTGMKSQIQHPIKTLGVDRLDSNLGYREDNIAPCCFVCNQIKGNRFSESEMILIGKSIKTVWIERIKALSRT